MTLLIHHGSRLTLWQKLVKTLTRLRAVVMVASALDLVPNLLDFPNRGAPTGNIVVLKIQTFVIGAASNC